MAATTPITISAAPLDTRLHVRPLNAQLTYTISTGETYLFTSQLHPQDQAELSDIYEHLIPPNGRNFTFNISDLTSVTDGTVAAHTSDNPYVRRLRALVQRLQGRYPTVWKNYPAGCRRSPDAAKPVQLQKMAFNAEHARAAFQPLQPDERRQAAKQHRAVELVLAAVKKTRKDLADSVPDTSPQEKLSKKLRQQKFEEMETVLGTVDEPALLFEATHRLDPNAALSEAHKRQALTRKQQQAKAWIDGCRADAAHRDALLEKQYAHDLLLMQTTTRDDYVQTAHLLGATEQREGLEVLYARLGAAVAAGNSQAAIEAILDDRVFSELLFGSLHDLDKPRMRDQLVRELVSATTQLRTLNWNQEVQKIMGS